MKERSAKHSTSKTDFLDLPLSSQLLLCVCWRFDLQTGTDRSVRRNRSTLTGRHWAATLIPDQRFAISTPWFTPTVVHHHLQHYLRGQPARGGLWSWQMAAVCVCVCMYRLSVVGLNDDLHVATTCIKNVPGAAGKHLWVSVCVCVLLQECGYQIKWIASDAVSDNLLLLFQQL